MTSRNCLACLLEQLGASATSAESISTFEVSGHVSSENMDGIKLAVSQFADAPPGWSVTVRDADYEESSIGVLDAGTWTFVIAKPTGGRLFFATSDGFISSLDDTAIAFANEICVIGDFSAFHTRRFVIRPWSGDLQCSVPSAAADDSDSVDPRRGIVRDLTGLVVPADPARWLLQGEPGEGDVWRRWCDQASKRLAVLFVSEIWNDGELKISVHGARKLTLPFGDYAKGSDAYTSFCSAATWLLVRQDAEARHEVLIRRLANHISESQQARGETWLSLAPHVIDDALEGARLDHRAYVRSKSAETVKAMAELRKAVGEDVSRITERIQRLAAGFAVGLAALAIGLGVRLTSISTQRNASASTAVIFCLIVLGLTWASFLLQRQVSARSLLNDLRHMRSWHRQVHIVLNRVDYNQLALRPVLSAVRLYKKTAQHTLLGMKIASLVFIIAFIAAPVLHTLETSEQKATPTRKSLGDEGSADANSIQTQQTPPADKPLEKVPEADSHIGETPSVEPQLNSDAASPETLHTVDELAEKSNE